jgi:protein-disulfide isomerase
MNRRTLVIGTAAIAALLFVVGWFTVDRSASPVLKNDAPTGSALIRFHSPVIGPQDAPVTIVEFFDPACEACRAMHPVLAEIRRRHPEQVRIVMRYATFHDGSDIAVRILESARLQNLFEPVLEALLAAQPQWADHSGARLDIAWAAAADAGLDVDKARAAMDSSAIDNVLAQDALDVETVGVRQTPTFFVDGRPLLDYGAEQLIEMVRLQVEARS